jgi:hypothetical protein
MYFFPHLKTAGSCARADNGGDLLPAKRFERRDRLLNYPLSKRSPTTMKHRYRLFREQRNRQAVGDTYDARDVLRIA